MAEPPLVRSTVDRKIGGVAAGIAQRYGLDPTLVRVAWVVATLIFPVTILIYLVLWIALPSGAPSTPATRIAEERYARGEISAEELGRIRDDLRGAS